jgi:hypothetical protein
MIKRAGWEVFRTCSFCMMQIRMAGRPGDILSAAVPTTLGSPWLGVQRGKGQLRSWSLRHCSFWEPDGLSFYLPRIFLTKSAGDMICIP